MRTFGDYVTEQLRHYKLYNEGFSRANGIAKERGVAIVDNNVFLVAYVPCIKGGDLCTVALGVSTFSTAPSCGYRSGIENYDPKDVEIFKDREQAIAANSWVVDADLRERIIKSALEGVPFERPEKVA